MWNIQLGELVTALRFIKMQPEFKGAKYEEALK